MLNDLITTATYADGGRGPVAFDCWGLARHVRHTLYARRLLPSWGDISVSEHRRITDNYRAHAAMLVDSQPVPGALAFAWYGGLLAHVGCVVHADGRRWVMDIDEHCLTPRLQRLRDFENRYQRVTYRDDPDLH